MQIWAILGRILTFLVANEAIFRSRCVFLLARAWQLKQLLSAKGSASLTFELDFGGSSIQFRHFATKKCPAYLPSSVLSVHLILSICRYRDEHYAGLSMMTARQCGAS